MDFDEKKASFASCLLELKYRYCVEAKQQIISFLCVVKYCD